VKIENVISAKSSWFMDTRKLNPRGRNLYKVIIPQLVQWYGFTEPKEPYDENHLGVQFLNGEFSPTQDGRSGDLAGVSLTVYFNGVLAQTSTSTEDADRFIDQALARLAKEGLIAFHLGFVKNRRYQSEVLARAERHIKFPDFAKFCSTLTKMAYPESKESAFSSTGIIFDTDPEPLGIHRKRPQFSLERKIDVPWSENLYYSLAPLSTPEHAQALDELEGILSA
jgi:hypothetical protein